MKFAEVEQNPRPPKCIKLTGRQDEGWRVRVGNYRSIYQIDDDARIVRVLISSGAIKAYKDKG